MHAELWDVSGSMIINDHISAPLATFGRHRVRVNPPASRSKTIDQRMHITKIKEAPLFEGVVDRGRKKAHILNPTRNSPRSHGEIEGHRVLKRVTYNIGMNEYSVRILHRSVFGPLDCL